MPLQSGPNPIDFGVLPPSRGADATFSITEVPFDVLLIARIENDDSQGRFRVVSLKSFSEASKPTDTSDGMRPLTVLKGQRVEIALRFHNLLGRGDQDAFTATLLVDDTTIPRQRWKPIRARMVAQLGAIAVTLPSSVQLTQGQQTSVPITVTSVAGPNTTVTYTVRSRPGGVSMMPRTVSLQRGRQVSTSLELAAALDARPGAHDIMLESSAFDGRLVSSGDIPVTVRSPRAAAADVCQSFENESSAWARDDRVWSNWGVVDVAGTILGFLPSPKLYRPTNQYEVAVAVREAEAAGRTIRALGSGWSFSDAVLPQMDPVEGPDAARLRGQGLSNELDEVALGRAYPAFANDFGFAIDTTTLDRSLQALLPNLLADDTAIEKLFFVEAGITINFLNVLLDSQTPRLALPTMGGASAQTIAGAFSTGTHGSDFDRAPLADCVRAIYLIGKGGVHHWLEPFSRRITTKSKIRATFPCITEENIHDSEDMFRSVLVSMGAMGVIYAVVLEVVPQYSLLQFNRWWTWEELKAEGGPELPGLFDGTWTGIAQHLQSLGGNPPPIRFAQVVINPIHENDGTHKCYLSNRAQLPLQDKRGVTPPSNYTDIGDGEIRNAIEDSPEFGNHERLHFGAADVHGDLGGAGDSQLVRLRKLLAFCKEKDYPWAVRAVINLVMEKSYPVAGSPPNPQVDVGFKVMAPGGTSRSFPTLGGTSVESAFSFYSTVPSPQQPDLRVVVPDVVMFVDAVLAAFDQGVDSESKVFPAGWLSLRVTGRTSALLGQQRFDRSGMVEVSLIGNPDGYSLVRQVEQITRDLGGALHWGQSNGLMTFQDLEFAYGTPNLEKWRAAQRDLGGDTFTNFFMKRVGLVPSPLFRVSPASLRFGGVPVGHTSPMQTIRITNAGSGDLEITIAEKRDGAFRWSGLTVLIPPGGQRVVEVEFWPGAIGTAPGALPVQSNAPGSPHSVPLTGTGLAPRGDRPPPVPV